jgi:hypothetical protein
MRMHAEDIEKDVKALCRELCLSGKCVYTASNETLLADGYKANTAQPQLIYPAEKVRIAMPNFKMQLQCQKLADDFMLHVKRRSAELHPLTMKLFDIIKQLEEFSSSLWPGFKTPMSTAVPLREWGAYPDDLKKRYYIQPEDSSLLECLEHLYEASAIIVSSHQSNLELSMLYLEMVGMMSLGRREEGLMSELADAWKDEWPRMYRAEHLKQVSHSLLLASKGLYRLHVLTFAPPWIAQTKCDPHCLVHI